MVVPVSEDIQLTGDNRPIRYIETLDNGSEKVVYRASSLGACERALVASARKHLPSPKPDWFQEVLDEGHTAEPLIRAMYEERFSCEVIGDQREVEFEVGEIDGRLVVVRGHIDGITGDDSELLWEAKKFRPSTWEKFERMGIECNVNYPWQVSIYMHALEVEGCEFVGGKVSFDDWGNLVLDDILVKPVMGAPFSRKAIVQRVARIERLINTGFDAMEVDCQMSMYPCPYWKLHDVKDEDYELPGDLYGVVSQLAAATAEVRNIDAARRKADERKKKLAAELRGELEKLGPVAEGAKKLALGDMVLSRIRKHVPAHSVKASDQDYFTIKPVKDRDMKEADQ